MTQMRTITQTLTEPLRTRSRDVLCVVCQRPIDNAVDSTCRNCDGPIHIAWKQGQEDLECSRIAPSNACGVSFVCTPCHEKLWFA